ncbi:MAG: Rrf2 family transcriptional regulator [Desulfobacteraceae bacterium]|nr:Rrf2 family transcriptional regulator [Desulfobacteraceae bacterium]
MKLSTRSRYGARLMIDVARNYTHGPVHLRDVAEREGMSVKYLEQLIIPLKKNGYIKSIQGPKGGYMLARPPEEITFGEIIRTLEKSTILVECVEQPDTCERSKHCPTRNIWKQVARAIYDELETITLADKI